MDPIATRPGRRNPRPQQKLPSWTEAAGFALLTLTMLFMMGLVVADVMGYPVRCGGRGLVVIVFALCVGGATGFLSGSASAKGKLPLFGGSSINVAVTGAVAAIVIVMFLGFRLYANDEDCVTLQTSLTEADARTAREILSALHAHDWPAAYTLFPTSLTSTTSIQAFSGLMAGMMYQFSSPPTSRNHEFSNASGNSGVIGFLAAIDSTTVLRETLEFRLINGVWRPFEVGIYPSEWPGIGAMTFLTYLKANDLSQALTSDMPPPSSVLLGRYTPLTLWRLTVVEPPESTPGIRTCDLRTRESGTDTVVVLRGVADGCSLTAGTTINVGGRLRAIIPELELDAVRLWS